MVRALTHTVIGKGLSPSQSYILFTQLLTLGCLYKNILFLIGLVLFCILPMWNLETTSIVLDINGAGWPQLVLVLVVGAFINTIMTAKFVYATYSKLSQMGRFCDKTQIS